MGRAASGLKPNLVCDFMNMHGSERCPCLYSPTKVESTCTDLLFPDFWSPLHLYCDISSSNSQKWWGRATSNRPLSLEIWKDLVLKPIWPELAVSILLEAAKLPLKTKASAFCGAPTAMTPAAAATAPVSMARARLSGAGTKAMLFRRQATAAKTHTAARRAMVRTGKGRGKAQSSLQLSKTAAGRTLIDRSKLIHFDPICRTASHLCKRKRTGNYRNLSPANWWMPCHFHAFLKRQRFWPSNALAASLAPVLKPRCSPSVPQDATCAVCAVLDLLRHATSQHNSIPLTWSHALVKPASFVVAPCHQPWELLSWACKTSPCPHCSRFPRHHHPNLLKWPPSLILGRSIAFKVTAATEFGTLPWKPPTLGDLVLSTGMLYLHAQTNQDHDRPAKTMSSASSSSSRKPGCCSSARNTK